MSTFKTAHFIKKLDGFQGEANLYFLDPPYLGIEYVVVSAITVPITGEETYIFHSDKDGEVLDWLELEGSFRGGLSHKEALKNIDYVLINKDTSRFNLLEVDPN